MFPASWAADTGLLTLANSAMLTAPFMCSYRGWIKQHLMHWCCQRLQLNAYHKRV